MIGPHDHGVGVGRRGDATHRALELVAERHHRTFEVGVVELHDPSNTQHSWTLDERAASGT